jgi:pyridoxal phosphate enzyme (YggS family)
MPDPIEENLRSVRERISAACQRSRRDPSEIRLIAVTKTFPAETVNRAAALGLHDVGENRVQELREKADAVTLPVRWHLIGHLQSNKAKVAARLCSVIHSIDSLGLAQKLSRELESVDRNIETLIQVNIGSEEQKSGVSIDAAPNLVGEIAVLPRMRLVGLMTIPPVADVDQTRRYFAAMRNLRDRIRDKMKDENFRELSMGMTDDFEVAIEEGATMIRVGRAIFGARG